ncbi:hypothetical protein MAR_036906 [Mya arenaria]|uniref:Uncharacterized protein n=1 Tax=Mya arenaria TaxID=6604 RepID=A0ABY7FNR2_MYAAR|nr:hypothetical protein MAR_036906 [Mya arenaria]
MKRKFCYGRALASMLDDDEASGSGAEMGSSPSQSIISGGSELFKSVLDDFVFDEARVSKIEFNRYKNKLKQDKHDEEHVKSRRCDSCQCVLAFCKCALYHGNERKFGHRVHWADEVWEKPLYTAFTDYLNHDSETDSEHEHDDGPWQREVSSRVAGQGAVNSFVAWQREVSSRVAGQGAVNSFVAWQREVSSRVAGQGAVNSFVAWQREVSSHVAGQGEVNSEASKRKVSNWWPDSVNIEA